MKKKPRSLFNLVLFSLLSLLVFFAMKKLYSTSLQGSSDLAVFWRSAHALWEGTNPYLALGEDRGFVFKYHPAVLALFLPFSWISLVTCKALWFAVEALSLSYNLRWLIRNGVRARVALSTTALFWYLWFEHFKYGQIMLPLLAGCLWAISPAKMPSKWRTSLFLFLMSIKVFTLYAIAGFGKAIFKVRTFLGAFLILAFCHLLLAGVLLKNSLNPFNEIPDFYRSWIENALHSAQDLGLNNVRGTTNHGIPAAILRRIDPMAFHPQWDTPISVLIALLLGTLWWKVSKRLSYEKKWAGWFTLTAVAHPLAWSHSFVFVYPLAAFSLQGVLTQKGNLLVRGLWIFSGVAAIGMMGLWVPQVVGLDRAMMAEMWGIKSWGALLCAFLLIITEKKKQKA
jgi:hypothetical protein